jgi:hypothetical protein
MYLSAPDTTSWPGVMLVLGLVALGIFFVLAIGASVNEARKLKIVSGQEADLRQLVHRYEQLAETTLDAQQRVAADVSELRSRTASIEQILRTVE